MSLQTLLLASSLTAFATLAACSTPTEVTTRDGHTITTPDKPKTDDEGFINYKKDGKKHRVNRDEVRSIDEVK